MKLFYAWAWTDHPGYIKIAALMSTVADITVHGKEKASLEGEFIQRSDPWEYDFFELSGFGCDHITTNIPFTCSHIRLPGLLVPLVSISSPKPISKGWNLLAQAGFEFAERQCEQEWY